MENPCLRGAPSALTARLPPELSSSARRPGLSRSPAIDREFRAFEHDPEKWAPVFRKIML
jgi:hypothetical protein